MTTRSLLAGLTAMAFTGVASAAPLSTVFMYDADNGTGAGTPGALAASSAVVDQSTSGNNGNVIGGIATVEDDPFAVAGELSYSFASGADNRINTDAIDLLTVSDVAAAGGFVFDLYVKTTQTTGFGQFFAFAGTNGFRTVDGATEFFSESNSGGTTLYNIETPTGADIQDGQWHRIVGEFVGDTIVAGQVQGTYYVTVDGGARIELGPGVFDDFGEALDRPVGVGGRSAGGDQFEGLIYNPTLSLGVVPEPGSLALLGLGTLLIARRRRG